MTYANYSYNAWSEPVRVYLDNGSEITAADNIANLNPIRYRGYYYDTETGFYYLQSRYYDPVLCRFLNADGYASTGSGFAGYNMYAYCNNNPVNYSDPTGQFWGAVLLGVLIVGTLVGCSPNSPNSKNSSSSNGRDRFRNTPNLDRSTASADSYNCYGNALGKQIDRNPTAYKRGATAEEVYAMVVFDVGEQNIRRLDSYTKVNADENFVALRVGPSSGFRRNADYHFIVEVDGVVYNKPGALDLRTESFTIFWDDEWYLYEGGFRNPKNDNVYYDSEIIYFALKKEWYSN